MNSEVNRFVDVLTEVYLRTPVKTIAIEGDDKINVVYERDIDKIVEFQKNILGIDVNIDKQVIGKDYTEFTNGVCYLYNEEKNKWCAHRSYA